ncbi:NAD(P)H-quinone oxidoreductase [Kocuria sp. cx-455]|uniref:NAD(P)H-quinone oxidoreductase n=1 Tax=Kocuria sp. cx-455 TaxID=2771377 RepID=UPI0016897469|nr:NAD(P)H-quinone oxidoreductase [Kocuria sp. cx-455]MBD2766174.1 NAD(P)H-quinone oxidoreductase [Kocuria sp. cx-455]
MRAVRDSESGGPEVLKVTEVDDPLTTGDGVLIEVAAAGLNRADVLQRQGNYPVPPDATDIFGLEVSGTIAELGPEVPAEAGLTVGDKVVALLDSGGYADKVVAPWPQVLPAPEGMDLVEAAGLPEVAATVFSNVFMAANAREGETLLVHGGTGGIGTHAIQVATALGLTVLATVGSQEKADFVSELGATAIKYKDQDFVERVMELTDGHGADVILDVVGAKYLEPNVKALATNGRITIIGMQGGVKGELNIGRLMNKRGAVIGTTLRSRPLSEKAQIMGAVRQIVWPHVKSGEVRPITAKTFPLERVREAHEYFDSGSHIGKVLLTM